MPTEQTPLIASSSVPTYSAQGHDISPTVQSPELFLEGHSIALLQWVRANTTTTGDASSRPSLNNEQAVLSVYLYAIHLSEQTITESHGARPSIRAILAENAVRDRVQAYLYGEVEQLLDNGLRPLSTIDDNDTVEEEDVEDVMWKEWTIDDSGERASAIDLLLRPGGQNAAPSPFLSHPLVRHVFTHTWKYGRPPSSKHAFLNTLQKSITPRRIHNLSLQSYIVFCCLTIILAIHPRPWITPYPAVGPPRSISAIEITWCIWSVSTFIESLSTHPTRSILLLPSALVIPFTILHQPTTAYTLLTLSIPTLFILLLLPYPPSLPSLNSPIFPLPLSRLLLHTLRKSLSSAFPTLPLALLLFATFAYSMNGDIFRGFDINNWSSIPNRIQLDVPGPVLEIGIAPFEARVWLFMTMVMLVVVGLISAVARGGPVGGEREGPRWKGGVRGDDDWEMEYGVVVGRLARRDFGEHVKLYAGRSYTQEVQVDTAVQLEGAETTRGREWVITRFIVPLNLLTLPLDLAIRATKRPSYLRQLLLSERELLGALMLGPLCYLISCLDL